MPLASEPPYIVTAESAVIPFSGTGPNKERQEASHLHQVIQHPTYKEVLVPDLGADKTRRLVRDASGKWSEKGVISYKAGAGPRHVAFHGEDRLSPHSFLSQLTAIYAQRMWCTPYLSSPAR